MISVSHLNKTFDGFVAVNDLSFQIMPGDVVGFLGPNGAGKSTTMKMLTGFLMPSSGQIEFDGHSMTDAPTKIKQRIGYLPEGAPAYGDMTPFQFLYFIGQVRKIPSNKLTSRMQEVIKLVELESVIDKPIEQLSKGFKRRVGLAQAIIHDPDILILDEPTDGLDPNQKHQVRQLIQNLSKDKIVIVSTHILEEVSAVCNRVMVIANGQLKFDDTPLVLQQRSKYYHAVSVRFEQDVDVTSVSAIESVDSFEYDASQYLLTVFPNNKSTLLNDINQWVSDNECAIDSLTVEAGRLDQVFRELTQAGDLQ
jgi:ABC-2 type transport system ATP-binding protein